MTLGTSLLLIAIGAILRYAVHTEAEGFSIHTAGVILMVVGAVGLLAGLIVGRPWRARDGEIIEP